MEQADPALAFCFRSTINHQPSTIISLIPMHIALLRGINVGKAKRIAMADLRELLEGLGAGQVRTLLNSGNAVFALPAAKAKDFGAKLEAALEKKIGVSCRVMLLTAKELEAMLAANPMKEAEQEPSKFLIGVLAEAKPGAKTLALAEQDWTPDQLAFGPRCLYLWCKGGILESKLGVQVLKTTEATTRNWATMQKLLALTRA